MKKVVIAICGIGLILLFFSCVMNKIESPENPIILDPSIAGNPVTLEVEAGPQWVNRMQAGPLVFNVLPQFAVWSESFEGVFIKTFYISGADYKKMRHGKKESEGEAFYKSFLPLWASGVESSHDSLPSKENPYPDTMTSATPMTSFNMSSTLPVHNDAIYIFLEINKQADYNSTFNNNSYKDVGQPSLIYRTEIPADLIPGRYQMSLVGFIERVNGEKILNTDLSEFDTALEMIKTATIVIE